MEIYIDFKNGIHQFKKPLEDGKIKKGWVKKDVEPKRVKQLRDNLIAIDYTVKTGALKFDETRLKERAESDVIESKQTEQNAFAAELLEFFLERTLLLTDKQANILLRVETYYEKRGKFPPLSQLAAADPALWGMIAKAVEDGELPPLPESMLLELKNA